MAAQGLVLLCQCRAVGSVVTRRTHRNYRNPAAYHIVTRPVEASCDKNRAGGKGVKKILIIPLPPLGVLRQSFRHAIRAVLSACTTCQQCPSRDSNRRDGLLRRRRVMGDGSGREWEVDKLACEYRMGEKMWCRSVCIG